MATHGQHKLLMGILIPDFMRQFGIEVNKDSVLIVRQIFKDYLKVAHTSALDDRNMQKFCEAFKMLAAREFGVEVPLIDAEKTMTQLLKDYDHDF